MCVCVSLQRSTPTTHSAHANTQPNTNTHTKKQKLEQKNKKSVAIMSDAAHMLSDVSSFLVAIFAAWAATQPAALHYSFGYHRAEILGALFSVLTIW